MAQILIVDDELFAGIALRSYLLRSGHKVALAHNGEQGIDRALADPPDLIVTDWSMPKMDGGAMVDYLRWLRPTLPVLFVAGSAPELASFAATATAPTATLNKSAELREVSAFVETLLAA